MPVVGFINGRSSNSLPQLLAAFREGLKENGFVEGQSVMIEFRWADGHYDRLPALAADLVHRQVTVLSAFSNDAAIAAKQATSTIPIVIVQGGDPVKLGLVTSLNRPGGNVTGVTFLTTELNQKRVEVLHDLSPKATVIGYLKNPDFSTTDADIINAQAAAISLGIRLVVVKATTEREFAPAFEALVQQGAEAVLVGGDPFFNSQAGTLVGFAARHRLPALYQLSEYVVDGGLMSYGASIGAAYRLGGVLTGRVLKVEKPAELPVQRAEKIELVINLKTAKALGLTIPTFLLDRAERVIE